MPRQPQLLRSHRIARSFVLACAAVIMLSSCTTASPEVDRLIGEAEPTPPASATPIDAGDGFRGTPADRGEPFDENGPSMIYDPATPETLTVVLFGSGNCPPEPVSYTVGDDGKVTILTAYAGEPRSCTDDLSPVTYDIATPPEFDPNKGVALEESASE